MGDVGVGWGGGGAGVLVAFVKFEVILGGFVKIYGVSGGLGYFHRSVGGITSLAVNLLLSHEKMI